MNHPALPTRPRAHGFTLIEILVAIGVFALGAVAVASIFPTAIYLQKQTIADVEVRQFGFNVKALVGGRSVRFVDAPGGFKEAYDAIAAAAGAAAVPPVPFIPQVTPLNIDAGEDLLEEWSKRDRTYPAAYSQDNASMVFAPLIYDADDSVAPSWVLYAFVLERQAGAVENAAYATPSAINANWATADGNTFPSVQRVALTGVPVVSAGGLFVNQFNVPSGTIDTYLLAPAVQLMDNNGVVYRIDTVDDTSGTDAIIVEGFIPATPAVATHLWIGHPGTGPERATRNPAREVLVFADADPALEPKPVPPATTPPGTHHVVP